MCVYYECVLCIWRASGVHDDQQVVFAPPDVCSFVSVVLSPLSEKLLWSWDQPTEFIFIILFVLLFNLLRQFWSVCVNWTGYRSVHQNSHLLPHTSINPQPLKTSAMRMNDNDEKLPNTHLNFFLTTVSRAPLQFKWVKPFEHICMFILAANFRYTAETTSVQHGQKIWAQGHSMLPDCLLWIKVFNPVQICRPTSPLQEDTGYFPKQSLPDIYVCKSMMSCDSCNNLELASTNRFLGQSKKINKSRVDSERLVWWMVALICV